MKPAKIAEVVVLIVFGMLIMALIQANQARRKLCSRAQRCRKSRFGL